MAEITTIVSSTKSPSDKRSENIERKFKEIPVALMTVKVMRNVSGTENSETNAGRAPKKINNTKNTRTVVIAKSRISSENCSSISSPVLTIV